MCTAKIERGGEGGIMHNKDKKKEEGGMDLPEHTGSIFTVYNTILQLFKLCHFLNSLHLRHIICVLNHFILLSTIIFAIHTKPME